MDIIKKKYPILDEEGRPSTYPTYASQVFTDDGSALVDDDGVIKGTAENTLKLGGEDAAAYLQNSQVVNNFTTTEEGFVADARALKVLNDKTTPTSKVDITQHISALPNVYAERCTYQKMGSLCIVQLEIRPSATLEYDVEGSATTQAGIIPRPQANSFGTLATGESDISGKAMINTDGSISFRSPAIPSGFMSGTIVYFTNE